MGLDVDPAHVAAVEVEVNGGVAIKRSAVVPLRPGVLRDGEVTDPAALTEAIKSLWSEHKLATTVRLGIAHQRIVVRTLELPPLDDPRALDSAVRFTAPDHVPMPIDEAVLDYQSLGRVDTPAGPRERVVIAAVRRDMVEPLVDACKAAGLKLAGVDLSAFAMVRALPVATEPTLYVAVGGLTNIAVADGDRCLFVRAMAGGLEAMVAALADRRSLTLEHARMWLGHVGLATPVDSIAGDPEVIAAARAVLVEGVHHVADAVRNSLNFYRMQDGALEVSSAVMCGPAVAVGGFADELARQIGLPVDPQVVAGDGGEGAGRLTVAAGLAVDERP